MLSVTNSGYAVDCPLFDDDIAAGLIVDELLQALSGFMRGVQMDKI